MTGWTPSLVPSPTWQDWPTDLPGLAIATAQVDGAVVYLVRWHGRHDWSPWLSPAERLRLRRIGTAAGRRRFAASHAAWSVLPRGRYSSATHTQLLSAVAVAEHPVGLDAEQGVPRARWPRIARQQWPRDPPADWSDFLHRWVAMEAAWKCPSPAQRTVSWRVGDHLFCLASPASADDRPIDLAQPGLTAAAIRTPEPPEPVV